MLLEPFNFIFELRHIENLGDGRPQEGALVQELV